MKLIHIEHGLIDTLLREIQQALLVHSANDPQQLRIDLYGATMAKNANNDLQTFIAYLSNDHCNNNNRSQDYYNNHFIQNNINNNSSYQFFLIYYMQ